MTTTTNTTTPRKRAAQPKGKGAPKPTKKPTKKPATPRGKKATPQGLDPDVVAYLRSVGINAGGLGGGGTGAIPSDLRSQLEQGIWTQYVYLKPPAGSTRTLVRHTGGAMLNALTDKNQMSDAEFRQLQEKLYKGGFYGSMPRKSVSWGNRYDDNTRQAYASAIAANILANETRTGNDRVTLSDVIDASAQFGPSAAQQEGDGRVFAYQPPDPALLRETFRRVLPGALGHGVSESEVQQLVTEYTARYEKTERSKFDAEGSGGAALPAMPAPADFAMIRARELHPVDVGVVDRTTAAETFFNAITSGAPETAKF